MTTKKRTAVLITVLATVFAALAVPSVVDFQSVTAQTEEPSQRKTLTTVFSEVTAYRATNFQEYQILVVQGVVDGIPYQLEIGVEVESDSDRWVINKCVAAARSALSNSVRPKPRDKYLRVACTGVFQDDVVRPRVFCDAPPDEVRVSCGLVTEL